MVLRSTLKLAMNVFPAPSTETNCDLAMSCHVKGPAVMRLQSIVTFPPVSCFASLRERAVTRSGASTSAGSRLSDDS